MLVAPLVLFMLRAREALEYWSTSADLIRIPALVMPQRPVNSQFVCVFRSLAPVLLCASCLFASWPRGLVAGLLCGHSPVKHAPLPHAAVSLTCSSRGRAFSPGDGALEGVSCPTPLFRTHWRQPGAAAGEPHTGARLFTFPLSVEPPTV